MINMNVKNVLMRLRWFDFKMNKYKMRTLLATERQVA